MYINGFTRESVMKQIRANNLGYPAYNEAEDQCRYRGVDGNQCLVGCFIPDHLYEEEFEGENARVIFDKMPEVMPMDRGMLRKLQIFHDSYEPSDSDFFLDHVEEKLIQLEKQFEEI